MKSTQESAARANPVITWLPYCSCSEVCVMLVVVLDIVART
jgi:hypothetical protein